MNKRNISNLTSEREKKIRYTDCFWVLAVAGLFVVCLELFYRMIVNYNSKYESDVQYYVVENVKSGIRHTRLLNILFQWFYDINNGTVEANIYLATVIVGIVIVNYYMIDFLIREDGLSSIVPRYAVQAFSIAAPFIGPLYVPVLHQYYYRRSFASFAWHSPTQQSMTLFATLAVLYFLKMYMTYKRSGINICLWMATMISTFIATMFKPSYTINLVGTVLLLFTIELVANGKDGMLLKRFQSLLLMGCSILPSGIYMIFLHTSEFVEDTQFGEAHRVIVNLSHVINYEGLWASVLFGISFPIAVLAFNSSRIKDPKYKFIFAVFIMGVLQWALLRETGIRGNFGNFAWGRIYGSYLITLAASALFLEAYYDRDNEERRGRTIEIGIMVILLCWAILSQLNYFRLIITGHGYLR